MVNVRMTQKLLLELSQGSMRDATILMERIGLVRASEEKDYLHLKVYHQLNLTNLTVSTFVLNEMFQSITTNLRR